MKNSFLLFFLCFISISSYAQKGVLKGRVFDPINNESILFASIVLLDSPYNTQTDEDGNYIFDSIPVGTYALSITYTGYKNRTISEIKVTEALPVVLDIELEKSFQELKEVVITVKPFTKSTESPLSLNKLGIDEIKRNPGSNRDISRVIQSLPGVGSVVSFRNDILIRGGAPNENRFYIDGIEIPNINHFATQGASGGPVGIINPEVLKQVNFYAGAFPANRGNALSSVFDFINKDGRKDKLGGTFTVGASEIGATLEGPLTQKGNFTLSARRSYLQFLFQAIGLPFLPTYNDLNFRTKYNFNKNTELTFIIIGAIDKNKLNLEANETEEQRYILNYLPESNQWNYTTGFNLKNFQKNGNTSFVFGRSMIRYNSLKYQNNISTDPNNKILDYKSDEIENKFRIEQTQRINGFKINAGINYEYAKYNTETFNLLALPSGVLKKEYNSNLEMHKYGFFTQVSRGFLGDRLNLSLSMRLDGNNFNSEMSNPLNQFSPQFSLSYLLMEDLSFNANIGRYHQLPSYTVLGYRDSLNNLVNKTSKYISCDHLVLGFDWTKIKNAKLAVEGFYKKYNNYPFLLQDSVSLANLGGDFGVIGNQPSLPISQGRAYGVELSYQQKLYKGFYGIAAYTFVVSEFSDLNNNYFPSSWDSRNIFSFTMGKKFKRNWELGVKWRYSGGLPYTPYDSIATTIPQNWDVYQRGIVDYSKINSKRNPASHFLDLRIDKKWNFKKWNFNLYFDIQNAYGFQAQGEPFIAVIYDENNLPTINPTTGRYNYKLLENVSGTVLPSIGVIIEF